TEFFDRHRRGRPNDSGQNNDRRKYWISLNPRSSGIFSQRIYLDSGGGRDWRIFSPFFLCRDRHLGGFQSDETNPRSARSWRTIFLHDRMSVCAAHGPVVRTSELDIPLPSERLVARVGDQLRDVEAAGGAAGPRVNS